MYTLIDGFHLGLFRANFSNKLNSIRNSTGRGQNSWLCKSAAKELNKILPRTNPAGGQSLGSNLGSPNIKSRPKLLEALVN